MKTSLMNPFPIELIFGAGCARRSGRKACTLRRGKNTPRPIPAQANATAAAAAGGVRLIFQDQGDVPR